MFPNQNAASTNLLGGVGGNGGSGNGGGEGAGVGGGGNANNSSLTTGDTRQQSGNFNGSMPTQQSQSQHRNRKKPFVRIIEQPASKALRFRYECEGRSAGSIPGVNSTSDNKTYPTIEIVGYKGRAVVVVSCVTKDAPYRPHPHNLVGKEGCKKGVCTLEINSTTMRAVFSNLGIQCVKKKDIEGALRAREEIRVDPYKTGFSHRFQPSSIDLNSVRLCFQVFMEGEKGRFTEPLAPIVSDPIYDKKAMSDLVICRLCSYSATVLGNTQIILLCEKVAKEDISVRFYEENNGLVVWEAFGEFQQTDVHKQLAIAFKTPKYHKLDITEPAKVFIQLRRPSDGITSEPLPFEYVPLDSGRPIYWTLRRNLKRKPDLDIFEEILAIDSEAKKSIECQAEVIDLDTPSTDEEIQKIFNDSKHEDDEAAKRRSEHEVDSIIDEKVRELEQQCQQQQQEQQAQIVYEAISAPSMEEDTLGNQLSPNDKIKEWMKSNEIPQKNSIESQVLNLPEEDDSTLKNLLDQVAELDEIYSDHMLRRQATDICTVNDKLMTELKHLEMNNVDSTTGDGIQIKMDIDESFDDNATYSSLQIAFKNPIIMTTENMMPPTPPASHLAVEDCLIYDPVEVMSDSPLSVKNDICLLGTTSEAPPRPAPPKFDSPRMHITAAEEEKMPPLPPKRIRKQDSNAENRSIEANFGDADTKPRQPSPIIIMKTPDQTPPNKRLPPKPNGSCSTLPKQKKPGFFSKLFSRRKSKSDLSQSTNEFNSLIDSKTGSPFASREPSIGNFQMNDINRSSIRSVKSLQPTSLPTSPGKHGMGNNKMKKTKTGKPVGRSVSSVSGKRPHQHADVIHIPLKGDSVNSLPQREAYSSASTVTLAHTLDRKTASALQLAEIPISDGNMELVAIADRQSLKNLCEGEFNVQLGDDVDLTEAEHFALYTSVPPFATTSEFDELSAYYAAVDAGEILTPDEIAKRLAAANYPAHLRRKRQRTGGDPMHFLMQHQQKQRQKDQQDGRPNIMSCWNAPNIPPSIKTEPRDTSPQPFAMYRTPPNLTPSPQPMSPSNPYNNHGTPSPYSMMAAGVGGPGNHQSNTPMISPNYQQYNNAGTTTGIATTAGIVCAGAEGGAHPIPMTDIQDFNVFGQQQQQQQHQQYQGNIFDNENGTVHWEDKFLAAIINASNVNNNSNNNNNNNNTNHNNNINSTNTNSNMSNLDAVAAHALWNLASNMNQQQHNIHQDQQHQSQHQHHQQHTQHPQHPEPLGNQFNHQNSISANVEGTAACSSATSNIPNGNNNTNNNNNEHSLSTLLNFDSEQLVRINSEDQQMLRLNSDELQLSNLSIST